MARKTASKTAPVQRRGGDATDADRVYEALERARQLAFNVDDLVCAYYADRNPLHLLRAVHLVAKDESRLPAPVLGYLERAIEEIENPRRRAGKRPPEEALRDVRIIRSLVDKEGNIPTKVSAADRAAIAEREHMSEAAVAMAVSRFRRAVGKPARRDNRR